MKGRFTYQAYAGATHETVPLSFGDGLQFVFEPLSAGHLAVGQIDHATVDSATLMDALRSSDSTYATAARSLGLPALLPEDVLNDLGYALMEAGKVPLALTIFQRGTRDYPHSPNAYDSLGDGYLAASDTASAVASYRRALDVARESGMTPSEETQSKLAAIAE